MAKLLDTPRKEKREMIELGDILSRGTYAEIKKYLKKGGEK